MMYVKRQARSETLIPNGEGVILTTPGDTKKLLDIIKNLNVLEYEKNGLLNGKFKLNIFEDLIKVEDLILTPDCERYYRTPYGLFNMDLTKLYQLCFDADIEVYVFSKKLCS